MIIKMKLAETIHSTKVEKGEIALFYIAQAGFCIKTSDNKIVVIDAYLSDAAERLFSFKRMIPAVIKAEEVDADLYLSTHSHIDHLDTDALPVIAKTGERSLSVLLTVRNCTDITIFRKRDIIF